MSFGGVFTGSVLASTCELGCKDCGRRRFFAISCIQVMREPRERRIVDGLEACMVVVLGVALDGTYLGGLESSGVEVMV